MNRMILGLTVAVVCSFAAVSEAAVLTFRGTVTNATSNAGFLGAVPPNVNFSINLTVTDGAGPNGAITGGTFEWIGNSVQTITGGNLTLAEGGPNSDSANFVVTTAAGNGIFGFSSGATNSFITGTAINQGNVNGIALNSGTAGFTFITGGGVVYTGGITAVPEPASCLALIGLVGVGAWRVRRARKNAA